MKRLTNIVLFAVAMLLGSCDRESLNDQPSTGKGEVQIKLALAGVDAHSTRATEGGTSEEDAVNTVQLVIFNKTTGAFFKEYKFSLADPIPDNGVVWDSSTQTVTLKDILTIGTAYDIYVVANATIANASTLTSAQFNTQIVANTTLPLPEPTTASGLVMTGKAINHAFANLGTVLNIDLTRMVAKFQIKVVFDPAIATKLPNITFFENISVLISNMPIESYYYRQTTAFPSSASLARTDFNLNGRAFYLSENATKGGTAEARNTATQFILNIPYKYTDDAGVKQENHNNYYLLNINNSSVDPYEIVRNTSYNVTVTVNSLGDKIPTISGTTIKTVVKPWTIHEMSGEEGSRENIELSNTECSIYGDHAEKILVATVKMKTKGMVATASFSTEGTGFTLASPSTAQISYDTPTDIRINTTENISGGKVHVTVGRETKTITISRSFDHKAYHGHVDVWGNLFISDSEWCTLATTGNDDTKNGQHTIINSRDATKVYINATKTTLGDQVRIANIMATEYKSTDVVRRIVVVQQPYVTVTTKGNTVKWATGNIGLGSRPDGTLCYVIGAATEHSLLFMFNRNAGYNSGNQNRKWEDTDDIAAGQKIVYSTTGNGSNALAQRIKTTGGYTTIYDNTLGDPCKSVYSSDPKIQWRSPTIKEFNDLISEPLKWIVAYRNDFYNPNLIKCNHRGSLASNGQIFLPVSGLISASGGEGVYFEGVYNYAYGNQNSRVFLWSSDFTNNDNANSLNIGPQDIYDMSDHIVYGSIRELQRISALGVRCVRSK